MKKGNRFIALFLSVVMMISMIPATAISAIAAGFYDSTIEGKIIDETGVGVSNVSVYVYDITERELVDYYHTGTDGKWSTSECLNGNNYLISYYHQFYTFSEDHIIVTAKTGTTTLNDVVATKIVGDISESSSTDFTYELLNGSYIKITKYIGNSSFVVIPNEIDGYIVQEISAQSFYQNSSIETVVFSEEITSVGSSAFSGCSNLKNVWLNDGLVSINSSAFSNCNSLTDIRLPNTLTILGNDAFRGCTGLTEIELPANLKSIGSNSFKDCTNLKGLEFPEGFTTIGSDAFWNCTSFTEITLPNSITNIGSYAFEDCVNLTNVNYPS